MKKRWLAALGVFVMAASPASVCANEEAGGTPVRQEAVLAQEQEQPEAVPTQEQAQPEAVPTQEQAQSETVETQVQTEDVQNDSVQPGSVVPDQTVIRRVLDTLGKEEYRKTFEFLADGAVITEGYKGDAGRGLQQVLVDLGCEIAVDGAVGAKTMEALHHTEAVFGFDPSDQIDLELYSRLLPLAFLAVEDAEAGEEETVPAAEDAEAGEEETAPAVEDAEAGEEETVPAAEDAEAGEEETVPAAEDAEVGEEDETGRISREELQEEYDKAGGAGYSDYLQACLLAAQGRYYSAREMFEKSGYGDSAERAASCAEPLPETGELRHHPDIQGSDVSLTFTVHTTDESRGTCFKVFNPDGEEICTVLVRGGDSATVHVPAGTYRIMDGTGYEWYGSTETFGPDGKYAWLTFSEDENSRYDAVLDYGAYELEVNVAQLEDGAVSVGTSGVGWDESHSVS